MTSERGPREGGPDHDGPGRLRRRLGLARPGAGQPIYQITSARPGVRDSVDGRARRYLVSMGIRTICFIGAVAVHGWLRWVLLVGALVLPYLSVVFANSGRERIEEAASLQEHESRRGITGRDP